MFELSIDDTLPFTATLADMLAWAFAFGAPRTLEMKDVRAETMSRETEKFALRARLAKIFACGAQKRVMLRLLNLTRKCATYSDSDPKPRYGEIGK